MTFEEIRNDIWWKAGRPTNYNPATDIEDGGNPKLNRIVNRGLKQIACWKDPQTGQMLHIPQLISSFNQYSITATDTIAAVNNTTFPYYLDLTSAGTANDQYNDWGLELTSGDANGDFVVCVDYTGATRRLYYHVVFDTAPSVGDTVKLYKNFDFLLASTNAWVAQHISIPSDFLQILSIVDIDDESELQPAKGKTKFETSLGMTGTPTQWLRVGNKVMYNYWIDENRWYRIEYYRRPTELINLTDEPELDEPYHQAIVLWGLYCVQEAMHEVTKSQATWQELVMHMRSVVGAHEVRGTRVTTKMSLKI